MRASLALLSVKELRQVASKSLNVCQVNKQSKELQIDTILTHFEILRNKYLYLDESSKSFWGPPNLAAFNFISNALTEAVTRSLLIPPCSVVEGQAANPLEDKISIPGGASQYFNKKSLKAAVKKLHPLRQSTRRLRSFQDLSNFVIQSISHFAMQPFEPLDG